MKLKNVLSYLEDFKASGKILEEDVFDIAINPEKVKKGTLFVSLKKGEEGKENIKKALKNGAVAFLSGEDSGDERGIVVENERSGYALASKGLYGGSCDRLKLIAVTGTNGKTTTTKIISSLLKGAGKKVGTIGTLGVTSGDEIVDTGFTTPDPEILHKCLYDMEKKRVEYVIMEASAHALELEKLKGLFFEASVFTNLSQDHLDFFGDMENYFRAKKKLFSHEVSRLAIICDCGEYGERLKSDIFIPSLFYSDKKEGDCYAKNIEVNSDGTSFDCNILGSEFRVNSQFVGDYNIQNLLGGILCATMLGVDSETIKKAIPSIEPAEGRFNKINYKGRQIVVDFAHTPDGLEKVLKTAKGLVKNKLICVFGCGGNRDRGKRPIMGKVAEDIANEVVLTSDNPRFERPLEIIDEITKGMKKETFTIIPKREDAIFYSLKNSSEGDVIVIAGKGGEKYQDIDGIKHPYDDFKVIKETIERLDKMEKEKRYGD